MFIKGMYRDVLMKKGAMVKDRGWMSNTIAEDFSNFLAALLKKDFQGPVGIEYLAVGSGSKDETEFKSRVAGFFGWLNEDPTRTGPMLEQNFWVWAKGIRKGNIKYLDDGGIISETVNDRLEVGIKIAENEPSTETLEFKEFALLGIDKGSDGKFAADRLFLVNYVSHGPITKDKEMELSRTIKLIFPRTSTSTG